MAKKSNFFRFLSIFLASFITCVAIYNIAFADCGGTETVLVNCDVGGDGGIFYIVRVVMEILLAGVGVLSTISIVWAGFTYLTAGSDESKVSSAKTRILNTTGGIILAGLAFLVIELLLPGGFMRDVNVTKISLSFEGETEVGQNAKTKITIEPIDANDLTYSLVSDDKSIVSVSSSNVKCIKEGKALVKVISANGLVDTEELTCKPKTEFARIDVPERSGQDYSSGGAGSAYDPSKIKELVSVYESTPDITWEKLKKYAYDKYGIHEDNFIGIVAWARIENYENSDPGDGSLTYAAYLCNSVGINRALAHEKQGNGSGWLDEMLAGGRGNWGSVYLDARYYGSSGYYQSNLNMVKVALDNLYPNITNCSGDPAPAGKTLVYQGKNNAGDTFYVW